MPLQKRIIDVPFIGGLETKADQKSVLPTKLLVLENGIFTRPGEIGKRPGYDDFLYPPVSPGKEMGLTSTIFSRDDELFKVAQQQRSADNLIGHVDGWLLFTLDGEDDVYYERGSVLPSELSIDSIVRPERRWIMPDMAQANGYNCFVCVGDTTTPVFSSGQTYFAVTETETGARIIDISTLGVNASRNPHAIACGTVIHIWSCRPAASGVSLINLAILNTDDLLNPPTAMVVKVSDLSPIGVHPIYDVTNCFHAGFGGACSVVAYIDDIATGGQDVIVAWFDAAGALASIRTASTNAAANVVTVKLCYDYNTATSYIVVGWQRASNGDMYYRVYNQDSTTFTGETLATNATAGETARNLTVSEDPSWNAGTAADSAVRFYVEIDANDWDNYTRQYTAQFDGGAGIDSVVFRNCGLISKAFTYGSKARVWVAYDSDVQSAIFLKSSRGDDDGFARTDAKFIQANADGITAHTGLPQVINPSGNLFQFANLRRERLLAEGDVLRSINTVSATYGISALKDERTGPTNLLAGGGLVHDIDGAGAESGFLLYPDPISSVVAGAGGIFSDGDYLHVAVYEWYDSEGQVHRSAPSPPLTTTCALGGAVQMITLTIPCLHQGEPRKLLNVTISVYRFATDGIYHRCTEGFGTNDNDITVASIAYIDGTTDATLLGNEILYTDGGILENLNPPASRMMVEAKNRIFLIPEEDREVVAYSQRKAYGLGARFSDFLTIRITGGDNTEISRIDEKVIVFKEDEIWGFVGDGPNDLGIGIFTVPRRVSNDVGCVDRGSVVQTDLGLFFKSAKGIYLLNRGMQTQYIGAPVEAWNQYSVVRADLVKDKNQVRFILDNQEALVYDYLVGQWSMFDFVGLRPTDTTHWKGYCFTRDTPGTLFIEFAEGVGFEDGSAGYSLRATTAWIKLSGLQGYQRVKWINFLTEYKTQHTFNVNIYYDYIETPYETLVYPTLLAGPQSYMIRHKPRHQKCTAIKIEVWDTVWQGTEESFSITALTLELGVKKGTAKLDVAATK